MSRPLRLGLRANAGQFALLVGLNAFVGAMVGLERSVLPLVGEQDFGLHSKTTILAFVVAFGQDAEGEIYILTNGRNGLTGNTGKVYQLAPM